MRLRCSPGCRGSLHSCRTHCLLPKCTDPHLCLFRCWPCPQPSVLAVSLHGRGREAVLLLECCYCSHAAPRSIPPLHGSPHPCQLTLRSAPSTPACLGPRLKAAPCRLKPSLFTYAFKVLCSSGACFPVSWPWSQSYCVLLSLPPSLPPVLPCKFCCNSSALLQRCLQLHLGPVCRSPQPVPLSQGCCVALKTETAELNLKQLLLSPSSFFFFP